MSTDPQPAGRTTLAALLLVLLVTAPPLFVDLSTRDSGRIMENISIGSSQETFLKLHGSDGIERDPSAWRVPSFQAHARTNKPPGMVWLNLLAWSDLTPQTSTPQQLLYRARVVSAVLGLGMIAAVFWMGVSLRSLALGTVAAAAMGTMWFFQRQARTASYDIHFAAFAALSVAAAWWAIAPLHESIGRARRWTGWALAGVFLAAACLCKGPLALLVVIVPVIAAVAVTPRRRAANTGGFVVMLALAAALTLPWYVWILTADPNWSTDLAREYRAIRRESQAPWYYVGVLGLVAPWTVWLIGGLFLPFIRDRVIPRPAALIPWLAFVALLVAFSIPDAKQQRYILPAIPAAALLIAAVFVNHHRAAQPDRAAALLYIPHWIGLLIAAVALPIVFCWGDRLVEAGWIARLDMARMDPGFAPPLAVVLVAMALNGWQMSRTNRPLAAAAFTVIYMSLATTVLWHLSDTVNDPQHLFVDAARQTAPVIAAQPAYYLELEPADSAEFSNMEEYLFYCRRVIPSLSADQLAARAARGRRFVVYARPVQPHEAALRAAGLSPVLDVRIEPQRPYRLWQFEPK